MKPIWTIIITVIITGGLVGGGGYYYLNQKAENEKATLQSQINELEDQVSTLKSAETITTDDTGTTTSTTTTSDDADDWKIYTNTTYDFSITFTDLWSGYDIEGEKLTGSEYIYWVYVPTTDESNSFDKPGYVAPIAISVYTLDQWASVSATEGPKPTKTDENKTYILAYSTWQDAPQDLVDAGLADEVTIVAKSAKFTD